MFELPTPSGLFRRLSPMPHLSITCERYLSIMGESLLVQSNHPQILEEAAYVLRNFEPVPAAAKPLCIRFFVRETNLEPPTLPPMPNMQYQVQDYLVYLNLGADNTVVADGQRGFAFVCITPQLLATSPQHVQMLIEAAAQVITSARDFIQLHAACVVKEGVGLLLQAPSGTGKSTLSMACLARGYQLLSEDIAHLKIEPQRVSVWGVTNKLRVLPDTLKLFPQLEINPEQLPVNDQGKLELDIEKFFPGVIVSHVAHTALVFLQRSDATPRLTQLSVEQVRARAEFLLLWRDGWKTMYDEVLTNWLSQNAYQLTVNHCLDHTVDLLDELAVKLRTQLS